MTGTKQVRIIEATKPRVSEGKPSGELLKVAAYARVSTDQDDQLNSYAVQIKEFTTRIHENPLWSFAGMYADEGISGTSKEKRPEFMRMIEEAKAGKINLILTKSLSRFARNTVDCLTVIRELRAIGVDVFFEKENIYSSDPKVDFMLTIFSSIAQEESRNISENIKWGYRKRFKDGKVTINTSRFLGFDKDENGKLQIDLEEAKTVRMIFNLFISGEPMTAIAKRLVENKIKNGLGRVAWTASTIAAILRNEKYCGDAILQKHVVVDYLSHRSIINNGIAPKYYISNNHEAIIPKDVFEGVQETLRKGHVRTNSKYGNQYPLSGIVRCGACGRVLNRHYFNFNHPNQRIVLSCKNTRRSKVECRNKPVDYETLMEATEDIIRTMQAEMPALIEDFLETLSNSMESADIFGALQAKREEIRSLEQDIKKLIDLRLNQTIPDRIQYYELALDEKSRLAETLKREVEDLQCNLGSTVRNQTRIDEIRQYLNGQLPISRGILVAIFKEIRAVSQTRIEFVLNSGIHQQGEQIVKQFNSEKTGRSLLCIVLAGRE